MSTPIAEAPVAPAPPAPLPSPIVHCPVIIEERVAIPGWIVDLASFRRWTYSDEFPNENPIAFLGNHLWLDLSMEELITHNRVKAAFALVLLSLLRDQPIGSFVLDRMRLTHPGTNWSTEPDGLFHTWDAIRENRLRYVDGRQGGIVELEGTPEMVLEIVSASSVTKDTVTLSELYYRASVLEYWLADARGPEPKFTIFRRGSERFEEQPAVEPWQSSSVLGRAFRLERATDPLGHALFLVNSRPLD